MQSSEMYLIYCYRNRKYLSCSIGGIILALKDTANLAIAITPYASAVSLIVSRGGWKICGSLEIFRREIFHPDFSHTKRAKVDRREYARALFFLRVLVTLRLLAEKASADDAFTRSMARSCTRSYAHISSRPFPSSTSSDMQPPRTHMHRARAREPRPRRQVPFTHTLASQTDSQLESNILK